MRINGVFKLSIQPLLSFPEKISPVVIRASYRILAIIFLLMVGIITISRSLQISQLITPLVMIGYSILLIGIKKRKPKLIELTSNLVSITEIIIFIEVGFLKQASSKGASYVLWNMIALILLIKSHATIIANPFAEFAHKCFTLVYFIIRKPWNTEVEEVSAFCFVFLFGVLDFIGSSQTCNKSKSDISLIKRLNRESQLNSFLMKNYQNNVIIDPSFLVKRDKQTYYSFISILKNSSLREDSSPMSLYKSGAENSNNILSDNPESIKNFVLNFQIEDIDNDTYFERGMSFEKLLLKISAELMNPERKQYKYVPSRELLRGRGMLKESFRSKEHKERSIEFIIYTFFEENDSNKPLLFLVLKDKSLGQENNRLKQFDAFKDRLLATVVHDMRAPLSMILGTIEMAKGCTHLDEVKENLKMSEINAKFLEVLISDILDFSLFNESKLNLVCKHFYLQPTLEECMSLIRVQALHKQVELKIINDIAENQPFYSDQRRLKQVIINLLTNAIKFTRAGSITLSVETEANDANIVLIKVSDTGSGIKKENIERLGAAYATFDIAEGVNKHGIGLGLFLSKTIIAQLGPQSGFLVHSEENKGTTMSFYIFKDIRLEEQVKGINLGGYERNPTLIASPHAKKKKMIIKLVSIRNQVQIPRIT